MLDDHYFSKLLERMVDEWAKGIPDKVPEESNDYLNVVGEAAHSPARPRSRQPWEDGIVQLEQAVCYMTENASPTETFAMLKPLLKKLRKLHDTAQINRSQSCIYCLTKVLPGIFRQMESRGVSNSEVISKIAANWFDPHVSAIFDFLTADFYKPLQPYTDPSRPQCTEVPLTPFGSPFREGYGSLHEALQASGASASDEVLFRYLDVLLDGYSQKGQAWLEELSVCAQKSETVLTEFLSRHQAGISQASLTGVPSSQSDASREKRPACLLFSSSGSSPERSQNHGRPHPGV